MRIILQKFGERILYGFGFGFGMGISFKLLRKPYKGLGQTMSIITKE